MSDLSKCSVVLAKPEAVDPVRLAQALAAARHTPLQDQINAAKRGWGILAENLDEPEAQHLAGELHRSNIVCAVLPASALIQLPDARPLVRMEAELPQNLILVAAAGFTVTSSTKTTVKEGPSAAQKILNTAILLGTGLPIKIGGKERTVEKTQQQSDRIFYLDLLYKDPLRRLRIDAQRFDYSFLKERKLYQVFGNFKLLVGDFVRAAPNAWRNHGTKILMAGTPVQAMGYDSLEELDREIRWLLTLHFRATGESPLQRP